MGSSPKNYRGTKYPMIRTPVRQQALAEFLHKRREMISKPADDTRVGERRRRTVGLRREEVAEIAAISSNWCTRLEQGKEVAPSSAVLGRIADVLQMAPAERAYLFELARRVDPSSRSTGGQGFRCGQTDRWPERSGHRLHGRRLFPGWRLPRGVRAAEAARSI